MVAIENDLGENLTAEGIHTYLDAQAAPVEEDLDYEADLCGNIEQALKALQGYGIMALELIQNADDAGAKTLRFDARADALVVENDAVFTRCSLGTSTCDWQTESGESEPRRECNFHAIRKMGGRSKIGSRGQIGRFGIGFVSVYQITDTPIIRSAGVEFRMNPRTGKVKRAWVPDAGDTIFELPWAAERSAVRQALNAAVTPADVADRVVDEVTTILPSSLLFLRHLEHVEVLKNGRLVASVDIHRIDNRVDLHFQPDGTVQSWLMLSRPASDVVARQELLSRFPDLVELDRSDAVNVAFPADDRTIDGLLYAYLPTRQDTAMPLHINADFFPHASRQHIVLEGEGHERYWNEALLAGAAAIIEENFQLLRDKLGAKRLWSLGATALERAKDGAFGEFWTRFSSAASASPSVLTVSDAWELPGVVRSAPREMDDQEHSALSSIGLNLLHPSLRPYWNALHDAQVGVRQLGLPDVASNLAALPEGQLSLDNPHLRPLWSAVGTMIERGATRTPPAPESVLALFKSARFLLDRDGRARTADELRRLPDNVPPDLLGLVLPDESVAHPDVLRVPRLAALVRLLRLDDFAAALAQRVSDQNEARALVSDDRALGAAYKLLTLLWNEGETTTAGAALREASILRNTDGSLVEPCRAQLPGHFRDPTGYFELVDTRLFPIGMDRFAKYVLDVSVLSFPEWIERYLEDALERGVTRDQYRSILEQIAANRHELAPLRAELAEIAFVRTRAGSFARPCDCYFLTSELQVLLGNDPERWVDLGWLPAGGPTAARVRDVLEDDLGMPTTVSAEHIVARVAEVADAAEPEEAGRTLSPIMRHVVERWTRFDDAARDELAELADVMFIPGLVNGVIDTERLYYPTEVYRATRAVGFDSQVPIVGLQSLRQSDRSIGEFLDLLGMEMAPETGVVVDHLLDCIEHGRAPSDVTYAILSERFNADDGIDDIDRLRGEPFIWDKVDGFLPANLVFWHKPPLGGRWRQVSDKMRERQPLFSHLGVAIAPEPRHYAHLVLAIADDRDRNEVDARIHRRCLSQLATELETGTPGIETAIDELAGEECLLTIDGSAIWPSDAFWMDSDAHLAPFSGDLDHIVAIPPDGDAAAVRRFFDRLGATPLSKAVRIELAKTPVSRTDAGATATLRDRADLLIRLAPTKVARETLAHLLNGVEVRLAEDLLTLAELATLDEPVRSEPTSAEVYLDEVRPTLYLKAKHVGLHEWSTAARRLLGAVAHLCPSADMRALAATAHLALILPTRKEAEEAITSHGFRADAYDSDNVPDAEEMEDADAEADEGAVRGSAQGGDIAAIDEELSGAEDASGEESVGEDADGPESQDGGRDGVGAGEGSPDDRSTIGGGGEQRGQASGASQDDPYQSKAGTGGLGEDQGSGGSSAGKGGARPRGSSNGADRQSRRERKERSRARSRMRSYVARDEAKVQSDADKGGAWDEANDLVDEAAVAAVLAYERANEREPEEQSHTNPGYDVLSIGADGARRLIEVKGINGDWDGLGVKLSAVQYRFARDHPEEFWLYVVEHALDEQRRHVRPMSSPFARVDEYWFDGEWRKVCEVGASARELMLKVGARVEDARWGRGTIEAIEQRGIIKQAKVRFDIFGLAIVPVNKLTFI
jgi:hypothetical protein